MTSHPPRRIARLVLLVLFNAAVTLAACEVVVRIAGSASRSVRRLLYVRQDFTAARYENAHSVRELVEMAACALPPRSVCWGYTLNGDGLRTRDYSIRPAPGVRRVVVVADSFFAENAGVPDPWHVATILERELQRDGPAEVVNLAVPGVGPRFERRMIEVEAGRLGARDIVMAFFAGNDPTDEPEEIAWLPARERLLTRWYTFRLVRNLRSARAWRAWMDRGTAPDSWPPPPLWNEAEHLDYVRGRAFLFWEQWPAWLDLHWDLVLKELLSARRAAEAGGAGFLLVVIPDEAQVDPALENEIREGSRGRTVELDKIQQRLSVFCRQQGIPMLDLLPAFRRAAARGIRIFQPLDTHWGPEGQRVAAALIARRLEAGSGSRARP